MKNLAEQMKFAKASVESAGVAFLFQGSCHKSKAVASHVVINALGTLFLGASKYCMLILSAPSRKDIDRMHARKIILDVGVNSVGSMFKPLWSRRCQLRLVRKDESI